jgi:ABC-type ATPase involved in cell division
LAELALEHVGKVYRNGYEAIHDFSLEIKEGEFLKNWKHKPFLWLAGHSEYEKNNWKEVTKERLNKLPDFVKNCIN